MKKNLITFIGGMLLLSLLSGCSGTDGQLFNGKNLDNWMIFTADSDIDPTSVFWVEEGMIHTSGVPNGYIRTTEPSSHFTLHVEWTWMEEPTKALEGQLMHQHAGDIVLIGRGAGVTVSDSAYLVLSEENRYIIIPRQQEVSEHQPGEWNSYDITSLNGSIEVEVNGVLQNSGRDMTLTEGYILLQSEGSPMQFRNIYLEEL